MTFVFVTATKTLDSQAARMSVSGSNDESAAVTGVTVREPVAAVALTKVRDRVYYV